MAKKVIKKKTTKKKAVAKNTQVKKANPKPEGYVFGRPTKYRKEYCQKLIDWMEQGFSYESFAGTIDSSKQTIYDWEKKHPDFVDAKRLATSKCQVFWESQGLQGLWNEDGGPKLNTTNWIFQMKNRFFWKDRNEISTDDAKVEIKLSYDPNQKPDEK